MGIEIETEDIAQVDPDAVEVPRKKGNAGKGNVLDFLFLPATRIFLFLFLFLDLRTKIDRIKN